MDHDVFEWYDVQKLMCVCVLGGGGGGGVGGLVGGGGASPSPPLLAGERILSNEASDTTQRRLPDEASA